MNIIKRLIKNCTDTYTKKEVKYILSKLNEKELMMFKAIQSDTEISNKRLAKLIYDKAPSSNTYQKLKDRLREKLYCLEFTDIEGTSIEKIKKSILKRRFLVRSMENSGFQDGATKIAKLCLNDARKYQMYDVGMEMCRILYNYYIKYGLTDKYQELAQSYYDEGITQSKLYDLEKIAEYGYNRSIQLARKNMRIDKALADQVAKEIKTIKLNKDSHRLHYFYFMLKIIECEFRGDHQGKVANCKNALDYFDKLHFHHDKIVSLFRNTLISTYINQDKLALAENIAHFELSQGYKTGHDKALIIHKLSWIKSKLGKYSEALDTINKIKLNKIKIEAFKGKVIIDKFMLQLMCKDLDGISLIKIKRSTPIAQEDKNGLGLTLLIGECLYHHLRGRAYLVEDRANELTGYIEQLNESTQARQINLLNRLIGRYSELDESSSIVTDAEIVSFERLGALVGRVLV